MYYVCIVLFINVYYNKQQLISKSSATYHCLDQHINTYNL